MMALDVSIRIASEGLRSARASDRRKNAEILKDFLTRNAAPSLLTENTRHRKGYTWTDVFDDINDYILKETEKYETAKSFDTVTVPLCTSLLSLCVAGANRGQAHIKCEKITEACLNILKDNRLAKAIGDTYLNLLYKHFLPIEYYMGHITPSTWEDLLDVAVSACLTNNSKLDDFTKLRLVLLIVNNGSSNCQYVIPLRDSLSRLKKCFLKVVYDKKVQEVIVEIVISLLDTLSTECRLTMCHFSETTLSSIFKFYDQNMDQKKKSLVFKLLHGTVVLHHPRGRLQNEEGSLACDWAIWNKHLHSILEIVCLEITFQQKARKQNDKPLQTCTHFVSLAASVYFQIFKHMESQENDPSTSSKRQKLNFNKNKTFGDLIDECRQNHIPWLGVIHMFIKNHGQTLSIDNYISLMNVIGLLITKNNSNLNWDIFEELTCITLKNLMSNSTCRNIDNDILTSLWSSCVRNSTSLNTAHKAIHTIMQSLLSFGTLKYENALSLIKLYRGMSMPVTNSSVKTLSILFYKFYKKCSHSELRISCLTWLKHGDITSVEVNSTKELLVKLVADENISSTIECKSNASSNTLYDTLFISIEHSILFSEFELKPKKGTAPSQEHAYECLEINAEVEKRIQQYFTSKLTDYIERQQRKEVELLEFIRFVNIAFNYWDFTIKTNKYSNPQMKEIEMYCVLKRALTHMFVSLNAVLSSTVQILIKIKILQSVTNLMVTDFESVLCTEIRSCIDNEFFHCVNNILNTKVEIDDEEIICEEDNEDISVNSLKHHCIYVIAAYCRKVGEYRQELLDLILDPKIYNFKIDVQCALHCIELLSDPKVEQSPLGLLFILMANMCRDLYRDSKASFGILKMLIQMLDSIWQLDDTTKQNCFIMVKSYLQRCEKLFYPPSVAALIYECGAKIATLYRLTNRDIDTGAIFDDAIKEKVKGEVHSIRVYCSYLLKSTFIELSEEDTKAFLTGLQNIFLVKVSEKKQWILKDESANRTLTVLHVLLALVETKKSLIQWIVSETLQFQKDRSVDKELVRKVLNIIVNTINIKDIHSYLDSNILSILYVWFKKNNSIEVLPMCIFGYESIDVFVAKHMKSLISAEILWRKKGNLSESDVLNRVKTTANKSVATVIEECFCNIIALCLPYIVTEKYKHDNWGSEVSKVFKQTIVYANKTFQQTGQILPSEKWTNLFVENVGELLLLVATHLSDHTDANRMLKVNITQQTRSYFYPKSIYLAILDYIGELTDGNIMQYLCENQPMAIFQILFQLWKNVIIESVFEFRVLALHAYITFIESVPFGYSTDAFVCNFACNNFAHAIKDCKNHEDMKLYVCGLKIVLEKWLPDKVDLIRKSVSQLLPILLIKKEVGYEKECMELLNYLVIDMKDYLKEGSDVVDFISSISQRTVDNILCTTMPLFLEKLKTYKLSLVHPSYETLLNLRQLLKSNKHYIKALQNNLDMKGFSEECQTSIIHQVIWSLNNILQSANDNKTVIEACNCLSEIGTYDLKTLVTVSPTDTQKIVDTNPKQYFAVTVVKSLTDVLFDEDSMVTNKVAETLYSLLKHFEDNAELGLEDLEKKILKPLSSANNNIPLKIDVDIGAFDEYCAEYEEGIFIKSLITNWLSNGTENHFKWLQRVTHTFLNLIQRTSSYVETLQQVCSSKANVCNKILPALIGLILYQSSENYVKIIGEQINKFFTYIWDQTFDDKVENSGDSHIGPKVTDSLDHSQKMVVQYMLDIVNFVRLQRNYYKRRSTRTVETLNYLRLEYDKVAWAATVADQNLAALYYGELWTEAQNDGVPPSSSEATTNLNGGANIQQIFRKCYVSIGEMDAVDGCGTAHLTIESEKLKHLINTGQYTDALLLHDIALSCGPYADHDLQCGVVRSLHKSGMHHLALQYIKSLPENDELSDIKYECLSFLGDWSDFADTKELEEKSKQATCNHNSILKAFHYACLKDCLNIHTTHDFENRMELPLNRAKLAVSRLCQNLNMENCQGVYKVVSKLHMITDIEDYYSVRTGKLPMIELLNQWQTENLPAYNDFKHLEALISQRVLILEHAAKSYNGSMKEILSLQIQYAKLGLTNNTVQMAQRVLAVAKKLQPSQEISLVDSEISWAKGHKEIALSLLRNIVTNEYSDDKMSGMSLRQYGLWMAECKRDNARDIINKYLLKSLAVLRKSDHSETRMKVYYDIAKFADAEYKQVVGYMNSSIFENKVKCLESMRGTASSLRSTQETLTRDERKALLVNDRFRELDEAEIASTRAEKESFLHLAMRYYLLSLRQSEENNLSVFRVISLWVENPSFQFEDTERTKFSDQLRAIPSRKFITVLPQLAPRLTNDSCDFADNLRMIIKRCAIEHPHHTLPILFSLKNSDKDKVIMNASAGAGGGAGRGRVPEPRVLAADALVKLISEEDEQLAVIVAQMEKICDATISFANYKPRTKESKQKIPVAEKIHKLRNLNAIPVPTVVIPVRNDCKYIYLATIQSFENYFELVGGINCPKKISCTDSSGNKRILLIKGEDDLRQDAVMQQVFNIVNTLLEKNPVTSRKKLLIRTYKVVPMSRQSGVLEWCVGTMPIGFYLSGARGASIGAHARYRPQDISSIAAREKMIECHNTRKSNKEKLAVFTKILSEFKPAFHYFFTEHYLNPVTWYERRLAYTNSVATSSMVGYILGLGDRHVQNILIDKRTAEVVHIDFGIAFDQGKTLPTPETIPFRLTQDIIAGFGSSGVDGIFRRCCEKTMQLLRDNQETLLTILEVLLCDPLYSWTVSTTQQNNPSNRDLSVNGVGGSNSGLAERALLTVSSKLSGTEGGAAGGVAVPGQVARLLQTATDPANLCRLFPGWQPYL